jgi:hypothetical protein
MTSSCSADTSWTYPTNQNMSMISYRRFATTAYDHRNLSIIDIQDLTDPADANVTSYNGSDFRYIDS